MRALLILAQFFIISVVLIMNISCQNRKNSASNQYLIPWPDENNQVSLRTIELKTLDNPGELSGSIANIYINPSVNDENIDFQKPKAEFSLRSDGVRVANDYNTLQALSVYAHYEKFYEQEVGLGIHDKFNWPRKIAVALNIGFSDNAFYIRGGGLDAIMVLNYTGNRTPISFNAGILAHEHFHEIYNKLGGIQKSDFDSLHHWTKINNFDLKDYFSCDFEVSVGTTINQVSTRELNGVVAQALNEGLADVWGWLYSNDSNFINNSFSEIESEDRKLDSGNAEIPSLTNLKNKLNKISSKYYDLKNSAYLSQSYCLGTRFARTIYNAYNKMKQSGVADDVAKRKLRLAIIDSISSMSKVMQTKNEENKEIDTASIIQPILSKLDVKGGN